MTLMSCLQANNSEEGNRVFIIKFMYIILAIAEAYHDDWNCVEYFSFYLYEMREKYDIEKRK